MIQVFIFEGMVTPHTNVTDLMIVLNSFTKK